MNKFLNRSLFAATMLISGAAVLFAAPEISVDSANFDMGTIREGAQNVLEHTYIVKNTGNDTLKISRVKPSCGCTAVGHDSVIAPGKTGNVSAKVKIAQFKPGNIKKYVTIYSNAKKHPELTVSIACHLQSELNIEPSYIRLVTDEKRMLKKTLTIVTNKPDLVINSVNFREEGRSTSGPAWQENLPINFSHTLTKTDTKHPDDFVEFKLEISLAVPAGEELSMGGTFEISTNHPTKSTVSLNGNLEPPEKK